MASWNYQTEVAADSPLHWYRLNETSGTTATDDGSAAEDATYAGTAAERVLDQEPIIWGANPGPQGRCLLLNEDAGNADDGRVELATPTMPTSDIACEFWIEDPSSASTVYPVTYVITGPVIEFGVELQSAAFIRTYIKGTATSASLISPHNVLNDGKAHHIYVDWRNSDGRLRTFVDGVQHHEATAVETGNTLTSGGTLMIGQNQSSPGTPGAAADAYPGRIDQVAIYSAPLTAARIQTHASAGLIRYVSYTEHAIPAPSTFEMGGAASFIITAFDPLRGSLISSSDTMLVVDISQTIGTLDPDLVTLTLDGTTIYSGGDFTGEFTTSSVTDQGGGVFRFDLTKDTNWDSGSRHELRVFLPGE